LRLVAYIQELSRAAYLPNRYTRKQLTKYKIMSVISDNEAQNFEEKARRGQEILDLLKKLGTIEKPSEPEKQEFEKLRQELNEINNWFQRTGKF
jgi:hypothetical protein